MEQLTQLLQTLADRIGLTVAQLWPHVVTANYVEAWARLLLSFVFLMIGFVLFFPGFNKLISAARETSEDIDYVKPAVHAAVGGLVLFSSVLHIATTAIYDVRMIVDPIGGTVLKLLGK